MMQITRTISLTGRKKIPRSLISIELMENADGELFFDATLNLQDLKIPASGRVFIQPYYKTSSMWFDCGTVGSFALPDDTALTEIDLGGSVLFRVFVVDETEEHGKILASAERVPAKDPGGEEDRESLINVRERDLGHEVWKLELEEGLEKPELVINNQIPGAASLVEDHGLFHGLLLPSIIRLILSSIFAKEHQGDGEGDEDSWQSKWIRFSESLVDEEIPKNQDVDENEKWIDNVVSQFSKNHKLCRRLITQLGTLGDA